MERLPCSRNSIGVAKKNGQTNLAPISELGICSRPVWGSAYGGKSAKRPPWKWWILRWIFCGGFVWSQNAKEKSAEEIRRKVRQPKTKNPPAHDPPEIRQPGPRIRRKTYQQIRLSQLRCCSPTYVKTLSRPCKSWKLYLRHRSRPSWKFHGWAKPLAAPVATTGTALVFALCLLSKHWIRMMKKRVIHV